MDDTPREIAEIVHERLLAPSGFERVLMGCRMPEAARAMVLASFPTGLSPIEIKARLCEQLYGDEVNVSGFVEYLKAREGHQQERSASTPDEPNKQD